MGLCYATYCYFFDGLFFTFDALPGGTSTFIVKSITVPFNRYEYVIKNLFCFDDVTSDIRFMSKFCQGGISYTMTGEWTHITVTWIMDGSFAIYDVFYIFNSFVTKPGNTAISSAEKLGRVRIPN